LTEGREGGEDEKEERSHGHPRRKQGACRTSNPPIPEGAPAVSPTPAEEAFRKRHVASGW
jgi:hypothetical protein